MTGEITLQGRVLCIGGLKEKLLAAQQHGMTTVILPEENRDDAANILKEITLDGVELIYVKSMDDVLKVAFPKSPFQTKKRMKKNAKRT